MIDEYNEDKTGWARFSDDMTMRFRLARSLDGRPLVVNAPGIIESDRCVTFALLNPSVADAFRPDPTVKRCCGFALALGADVVQITNANALRSTDPSNLYKLTDGMRGDDAANNREIVLACTGAFRVIAGWGKHGALGNRGDVVRRMLAAEGIRLHHLGLNNDGSPKHPLYLKGGTIPVEWS